jgi:hypothetical protein
MLPQLSAELLAQLQVNLLNSSTCGISRLGPLLGLLHKQLQYTDLGHCQVGEATSEDPSASLTALKHRRLLSINLNFVATSPAFFCCR